METRENPSDPTQAQWKNSDGEWVNFNSAVQLGVVTVTKPSSSTATVEVELPNVDPNADIDQIFPVITSLSSYGGSTTSVSAKAVPSVSDFTGSKVTVNNLFCNWSSGGNVYYNVKIVYPLLT